MTNTGKKIPCPFCDNKIEINTTTQNPQNIYCGSCKNKAEGFLRYFELEGDTARRYYERKFEKDKLLFYSISIVIVVAFYVIFLMNPIFASLSGTSEYNLTNILIYALLTPIVTVVFTLIPLLKNKRLYLKNLPVKIYFYKEFIVVNNKIIWDKLIKKTKFQLSKDNSLIEVFQTGTMGNSIVPAHYDSFEINDEFIKNESYWFEHFKR